MEIVDIEPEKIGKDIGDPEGRLPYLTMKLDGGLTPYTLHIPLPNGQWFHLLCETINEAKAVIVGLLICRDPMQDLADLGKGAADTSPEGGGSIRS